MAILGNPARCLEDTYEDDEITRLEEESDISFKERTEEHFGSTSDSSLRLIGSKTLCLPNYNHCSS